MGGARRQLDYIVIWHMIAELWARLGYTGCGLWMKVSTEIMRHTIEKGGGERRGEKRRGDSICI